MRFLFALSLIITSWKIMAVELIESPIKSYIMPYCVSANECSVYLSLSNETNLTIELIYYGSGGNILNPHTVSVWDFEKYRELEIHGKFTESSQLVSKNKGNEKGSLKSISFSPNEKKHFLWKALGRSFDFDSERDYIVSFYLDLAHVYIEEEYIGVRLVRSPKTSLTFPVNCLEPKLEVECKG